MTIPTTDTTASEVPESEQATSAPESKPTTEETGPEARFTQDDLDRAIEKRLARERRASERRLADLERQLEQAKAKNETTTPDPTPTAAPAANGDATAELARKLDALQSKMQRQADDALFSDTLLDANLKLTRDQRELLRLKFDPEEPEAIVEYARSVFASTSRETAPTSKPSPEPTQLVANPNAPSVARRAPPETPRAQGDPDVDMTRDLTELKGDELDRLRRDPAKFRAFLKEYRESLHGGQGPFPFGGRSGKD